MKKFPILLALIFFLTANVFSQNKHLITVSKDGNGDFKTLTEAVESLPMFNYERVVIFLKNGTYNEKIRIEQDNVTLRGENKDSTIIKYSQLRTDWIKEKDEIGPAVINIHADDIILENLTVENSQPEIGPHAFTIYGTGTRTIITNCNIFSKGGDTVSLWNYKNGMYYHSNCFFKGAVDYVCPRGWCYISNSKFYEEKATASVWHAGGFSKDQKFVIDNSYFDGVPGFQLARHHYDAQFYFLNCKFSSNLADKPVYRVIYPDQPDKNRPDNWGERNYFYNCLKEGKTFKWIKNNLNEAEGSPKPSDITAVWTFDSLWNPESNDPVKVEKAEVNKNVLLLFFPESITVIGKPVLKSGNGIIFKYKNGGGSNTLSFSFNSKISSEDLRNLEMINKAKVFGNTASINERDVDFSSPPKKISFR